MTNLVSMQWLNEHLNDPKVKIIDCRFVLGQPAAGLNAYVEEHLPNALYFDLERDLSAPVQTHGGRHPLPDLEELAQKIGAAGIDDSVQVVAYDDQGGAMASRFWWLMQYMGHSATYVLDGTFTHWKSAGYPTTNEVPTPQAAVFTPSVQQDMVVHMEDVKNKAGQAGVTLVDSREAVRYRGESEPIDPVAGHIPSAVNHFWKESLSEAGTWKAAEEQGARFAGIDKEQELIVYCGSGVTACPNILALKEAGYQNVKLYAGSWSDWCSYADNPIGRAGQGE